jgi:hypothetical protein
LDEDRAASSIAALMPRPQFTLRALLVLILAAGCFLWGIQFEREEWRRRREKALARPWPPAKSALEIVWEQNDAAPRPSWMDVLERTE